MNRLLACSIMLMLAACHTSAPAPNSEPVRHDSDPKLLWYDSVAYTPERVEMDVSQTECYGECPVFTVIVHGDGHVEYHGEKFVGTTGDKGWTVTPLEVELMLRCFERAQFLALKDEYDEPVSDTHTTILTLQVGQVSHVIHNHWAYCFASHLKPEAVVNHLQLDALAATFAVLSHADGPIGWGFRDDDEMK